MDSQRFDKEYKDFIASNQAPADLKNLWEELEPNLPAQKKRRRFIPFLFLGLGLILLVWKIAGFTFTNTEVANTSISESIVEKENNLNQNDLAKNNPTDDDSTNNEQTQYDKLKTKAESKPLTQESQSTKLPVDQKNLRMGVSREAMVNDAVPSKVQLRNTTTQKLPLENTSDLINNKITPNFNRESRIVPSGTSTNGNIGVGLGKDELISVPRSAIDFYSLPLLSLNQFKLPPWQVSMDQVDFEKGKSLQEVISKSGSSIEFGASILIPSFRDGSNTQSNLGMKLDQYLELSYGYKFYVDYKYAFESGVVFGLGLSSSTIVETFKIQEEFIAEGILFNEEAFKFNDDFIGADQLGVTTTAYNIFNRNSFQLFDLVPSIGYRIEGRLSFGLDLQALINLSQSYTGSLIDEDMELLKSGELFEERKFKRVGGALKASLAYDLTDRLQANLNLSYSQRGIMEIESGNFNVDAMNVIDAGMSLRYSF